jgi:pyruvate/2-oxoglutarate dehydrogenase complex dihydrolipoamide dehydrogenase (E3) component
MTPTSKFDAIIVGAGQAGVPLAQALAKAGWLVALIEGKHVGGTCINAGCTPTKTMIASARVAYLGARADEYGVNAGKITVNLEHIRARKNKVVESFRSGSQQRLEKTPNLSLIFGQAKFVAPKTLEVKTGAGSQHLEAEHVFINAGARPTQPDIPGLKDSQPLNSTSIMELGTVPEHLLILGGGYIALEFGQMFARFGSRVTMLERNKRFLEHEDEDIAKSMFEIMTDSGVTIRLGCQVKSVIRTKNQIELELQSENKSETLRGSHLLVASGRTPNSDSLDLPSAGVQTDARGFITVNPQLQTNVPGIYALGDIKGGAAFTHVSYDDFRIVRDRLLHGSSRSTKDRLALYTVFTDPQLGRVGLTETEAKGQGFECQIYTLPMSSVARAIETDETQGLIKAVVDAKTDLILGATVLGIEGGEIISVFQMAMMGNLTASTLRETMFAHPTLSEAINNLFASEPTSA